MFGSHLNKKVTAAEKLSKDRIGVNRPQKTLRWVKGRGFMRNEPELKVDGESFDDVVKDNEGSTSANIPEDRLDVSSLDQVSMKDTSHQTTLPSKYA